MDVSILTQQHTSIMLFVITFTIWIQWQIPLLPVGYVINTTGQTECLATAGSKTVIGYNWVTNSNMLQMGYKE